MTGCIIGLGWNSRAPLLFSIPPLSPRGGRADAGDTSGHLCPAMRRFSKELHGSELSSSWGIDSPDVSDVSRARTAIGGDDVENVAPADTAEARVLAHHFPCARVLGADHLCIARARHDLLREVPHPRRSVDADGQRKLPLGPGKRSAEWPREKAASRCGASSKRDGSSVVFPL